MNNWLRSEMEEEVIGFKNKRRNVRVADHQTGKTQVKADAMRKALAPGWRISKNGKKYYEGRKNRSDKIGKKV